MSLERSSASETEVEVASTALSAARGDTEKNIESFGVKDFVCRDSAGIERHIEVVTTDISGLIPDDLKRLYSGGSHPVGKVATERADFLFRELRIRATEGAFGDPNVFIHVVAAYNGTSASMTSVTNPAEVGPVLRGLEQGEPLPIDGSLHSASLWVNSAKSSFASFDHPTVLIDSADSRFRAEVASFSDFKDAGICATHKVDDRGVEAALEEARRSDRHGIRINFKKETPWLLVVSQILDPYHGRLVTVREKGVQATTPSPERRFQKLRQLGALYARFEWSGVPDHFKTECLEAGVHPVAAMQNLPRYGERCAEDPGYCFEASLPDGADMAAVWEYFRG